MMTAEQNNEVDRLHEAAIRVLMRGAADEGRERLEQALAFGVASLGNAHPSVLGVMQTLAGLDQEAGRYAEAEAAFRHILAVQEREGPACGPSEPTLLDLAKLCLAQNRLEEAEGLARQVLARFDGSEMRADIVLGRANRILSTACERQGRAAEATEARGRSQAAVGRLMAPMFASFEASMRELDFGEAVVGPEQWAELEACLRRSLTVTEQMVGPEHPALAPHLEKLAECLRKTGREVEAAELEARAGRLRGV